MWHADTQRGDDTHDETTDDSKMSEAPPLRAVRAWGGVGGPEERRGRAEGLPGNEEGNHVLLEVSSRRKRK